MDSSNMTMEEQQVRDPLALLEDIKSHIDCNEAGLEECLTVLRSCEKEITYQVNEFNQLMAKPESSLSTLLGLLDDLKHNLRHRYVYQEQMKKHKVTLENIQEKLERLKTRTKDSPAQKETMPSYSSVSEQEKTGYIYHLDLHAEFGSPQLTSNLLSHVAVQRPGYITLPKLVFTGTTSTIDKMRRHLSLRYRQTKFLRRENIKRRIIEELDWIRCLVKIPGVSKTEKKQPYLNSSPNNVSLSQDMMKVVA